MRWLADECVAARLVAAMRAAGHDVKYVAEEAPSSGDRSVLSYALREGRLLLTEDKDFGDLIFGKSAEPSFGVVLLRMRDEDLDLVWPRLQHAVEFFGERLFSAFTVVAKTKFRIHALDRPS